MSASRMGHTSGNAPAAALVLSHLMSPLYMACCHCMQDVLVLLYMFLVYFHSGFLIVLQLMFGSCI